MKEAQYRRAAVLAIAAVAIGTVAAFLVFHDPQLGSDRAVVADPFRRAPTPSDRLPRWNPLRDEVLATRRIAVYARKGHSAGLDLARTHGSGLCLLLVAGHAAAGSCSSSLPPSGMPITVMYGLQYASGRVRSDVRSVVIVGTRGRRHAGGGFIYRCPAFSGCAASVRSIEAYGVDGRLLGGDSLPG